MLFEPFGVGGSQNRVWGQIQMARGYRSFAEFERYEIQPGNRAGWDSDEVEPRVKSDIDFDVDPYEAAFNFESDDESEDDD